MQTKNKNQLYLISFCAIIGAVGGGIVWCFLKLLSLGTYCLWEWLPAATSFPCLPLLICIIGGCITGILRKYLGDYPEELEVVLGKIKKEKHYDYQHMLSILLLALLPLLLGSSVGPEAGLTGVIVALCYWAGDNLKFAKGREQEYSELGTAVSLGVLFHSPLFGIFAVEETDQDTNVVIAKSSKWLVYGIALAAATGVYTLLGRLFGKGLGGFPSFDVVTLDTVDYAMMIVYVLAGLLLACFYEGTHHLTALWSKKIPGILKEMIAGGCIGITALCAPLLLFSGEEQMGELMADYGQYLPLLLIVYAFFKVLLTNICIQFGLKGGHFFPLIFAGMLLGYGISLTVLGDGGHEVFASAIVIATLLGGVLKKPLAVTILLFLCFPARLAVWTFLSACIGSKIMHNKKTQD